MKCIFTALAPVPLLRRVSLPVALVILTACGSMTGCTTGYPRYTLPSEPGGGSAFAEVQFSDEISRARVKQTRELLDLQTKDYLVGPDDVLEVSIFEWEMTEETKTLDCRIAESGVISLPVIGAIKVGNKTLQEIQQLIEKKLNEKNIMPNPRVAISVKEYRSRRIGVIGAVNAPGQYAIHQNVSTLMDILALAGGTTTQAGQTAYILREKKGNSEPLRIPVNLEKLFEHGQFDLNAVLRGDDIVYVPRASYIYVYGEVSQPGGFSLTRSMRVLEAIALAGGLNDKTALATGCRLIRKTDSGEAEAMKLNVRKIEQGQSPNIFLRKGDVVFVPKSSSKQFFTSIYNVIRGVFTFTYRLDANNN